LEGKIKKLLLVPTGALVSKTASLQGETIPGIAHAICMERV
ncbi:MAG: stage V sporulation protein AD, partial [Clostridia bacterium]|nr:stage V sporulation protein AD [Clostridia bacterium]